MKKLLLSALFLLVAVIVASVLPRTTSADVFQETVTMDGIPIKVTIDPSPITQSTPQVTFKFETVDPNQDFFTMIDDLILGLGDVVYAYRISRGVGIEEDSRGETIVSVTPVLPTNTHSIQMVFARKFENDDLNKNWKFEFGIGVPTCVPGGCAVPTTAKLELYTKTFSIGQQLTTPGSGEAVLEPQICAPTIIRKGARIPIKLTANPGKYTLWLHEKSDQWKITLDHDTLTPSTPTTYNFNGYNPGGAQRVDTAICLALGDSVRRCNPPDNIEDGVYRVDVHFVNVIPNDQQAAIDKTLDTNCSSFQLVDNPQSSFFNLGPQSIFSPRCPGGTGIRTALGCIPIENTNEFAAWILKWAIGVSGGIAFLLMLYSGFQIMTASGNPEKLQHGRELLTAAISGLILIIFSVFLLKLIGVEILQLPGFGS